MYLLGIYQEAHVGNSLRGTCGDSRHRLSSREAALEYSPPAQAVGDASKNEKAPEGRKKHARCCLPIKKPGPGKNEALYDKLIATIPEIERKGDANPYTSLNGNMFTLLHQSRLALRLPEAEREAFQKKYKTTLFEAYGTVMKEYVDVPDSLLEKTSELKRYLAQSYAYAKTLKPKPTTKKKH